MDTFGRVYRRAGRAVRRQATTARVLREGRARVRQILPLAPAPVVDLYWWDWEPNFGDALSSWILPRLGVRVRRAEPHRATAVLIGSVLEHLPRDFGGLVVGAGVHDGEAVELPAAKFLAVRGSLTWELVGRPADCALGDPGLLVAHLGLPTPQSRPLALIPHISQMGSPLFAELARRLGPAVTMIDATAAPATVVRQIADSEAIISTSLHGLIIADALGIPAAWSTSSPALRGGTFKFRDYESVVTPGASRQFELEPGMTLSQLRSTAQSADRAAVANASAGLVDAVRRMARELPTISVPRFLAGR